MAAADQTRVPQDSWPHREGNRDCSNAEKRGLLLVGVFKISKTALFLSIGASALHLVHKNLGDLVMRVVEWLPIDPEGRAVSLIMDKADLIDARDLQRISVAAFIYAALCLIEGTGLLMRKTWAEYFTVVLTALGLPVESFELLRHFTWFKVGALAANLAILLYLLWVIRSHRDLYTASA